MRIFATVMELEKQKKQEAALVKAIQRAETIVESYENVKVYMHYLCVLCMYYVCVYSICNMSNRHIFVASQFAKRCSFLFIIRVTTTLQVFPMTGTLSSWLSKGKMQGKFDGIFVSSRVAQVLSETNFRALCKN